MSKFVQAFLTGIFVTFILDFFIFLGVKVNYIDFYKIDLYYNILFADNQNIFVYILLTIIFGYTITYIANKKLTVLLLLTLSILSLLPLIQPVGHKVGEMMLMKRNVTLIDNRHTYVGDIYYDGRKNISFYDTELKRLITLNKKDLKQ